MLAIVGGMVAALLLALPGAARAQVACGDVIEGGRVKLTADLDCTGQALPAVTLVKATLLLEGFTVRGGQGIKCAERCTVQGPGVVENSSASGIWTDLWYKTKFHVRKLTVRNNALWGVAGYLGVTPGQSEVHVFDAIVEGNGLTGVLGDRKVNVGGSTVRNNGGAGVAALSGRVAVGRSQIRDNAGVGISASGDAGVFATVISGNGEGGALAGIGCSDARGRVELKYATVEGNATGSCAPGACADVDSCARPKVRRSTCGTSHRVASGLPGENWGICALD